MAGVEQLVIQSKTKKEPLKAAQCIYWRPLGDLNPRRRRERAVSWARLDEGDAL